MPKPRWFPNQAGTMSTIVRPSIALSPTEYRWLQKQASTDKTTISEVLYHLTKKAIDEEMQRQGEWCE